MVNWVRYLKVTGNMLRALKFTRVMRLDGRKLPTEIISDILRARFDLVLESDRLVARQGRSLSGKFPDISEMSRRVGRRICLVEELTVLATTFVRYRVGDFRIETFDLRIEGVRPPPPPYN